jgi:DNA-binding MarR family transcriptional regulator
MNLKRFVDRSLIMGTFLSAQSLQGWVQRQNTSESDISFLGSLILLALYFEDEFERIGPSRLAKTLGFSRSRVSQELSSLTEHGLVRRSLSERSGRSIIVSLTSQGKRKAVEIVKRFNSLQGLIDKALGEKQAEGINVCLLKLAEILRSAT